MNVMEEYRHKEAGREDKPNVQGSTTGRAFPAKIIVTGNKEQIARYMERVAHLRSVQALPDAVRDNTPRLKTTIYRSSAHRNFVENAPTSHDLRSQYTPEALAAIDQLAQGDSGPDTDKMRTFLMPIISQMQTPKPRLRYIVYQRPIMDSPLIMLYAAIMEAKSVFNGRAPDALFINSDTEANLRYSTEVQTGRKYDGAFYVYDPAAIDGKVKRYLVMTEQELPPLLMDDLKGHIAVNAVVCAIENP